MAYSYNDSYAGIQGIPDPDPSYSDPPKKKMSNTPLILGGLAVLGLGYYLYTKTKAPTANTTSGKAAALAAAPGSTTVGTVPVITPPISSVVFNESPMANKVMLWKILSMFPLVSPSNDGYYTVGATAVSNPASSGASFIANQDGLKPGYWYALMSPSDGTILFVDEATAAAQASGPQAPWTLFLRPGEWTTVSNNAAQDAANTALDTTKLPNLNPAILSAYATSVAGA